MARDAASHQDHMSVSSELHFPAYNGFRVLPEDEREAVCFVVERGRRRVKDCWGI